MSQSDYLIPDTVYSEFSDKCHLYNIKATSTFILRFTACEGHRIMNNSRGLPTNQQARLQENKQFLRGRFQQVEGVTC